MLFSAKFSTLEKRQGSNGTYYVAHSSKVDKTGIVIFPPKDPKIFEFLEKLSLAENAERLGDYEFKITYRIAKVNDGSFKSYFNLIGINSLNSAD